MNTKRQSSPYLIIIAVVLIVIAAVIFYRNLNTGGVEQVPQKYGDPPGQIPTEALGQ